MKQKIELQKNNFRRQKMEVLKISSKSNPNSVAGAIAGPIVFLVLMYFKNPGPLQIWQDLVS